MFRMVVPLSVSMLTIEPGMEGGMAKLHWNGYVCLYLGLQAPIAMKE